ncbi:hypothetical protein CLV25_11023 [Acetobacteroides hydrogenigenes]|uniref:Uncharacterized protein n=1 Tax=Acetobacteroides hydrogenigenes TaxID=979970 RepID=A0A4R2EH87_9BACT|nr:hypothetical protein CLV25_11023 [Acetobacteroides hydrogenigenes]
MIKRLVQLGFWVGVIAMTSCESEQFADPTADWKEVEVQQLSADMQKVRDYVPNNAVKVQPAPGRLSSTIRAKSRPYRKSLSSSYSPNPDG